MKSLLAAAALAFAAAASPQMPRATAAARYGLTKKSRRTVAQDKRDARKARNRKRQ